MELPFRYFGFSACFSSADENLIYTAILRLTIPDSRFGQPVDEKRLFTIGKTVSNFAAGTRERLFMLKWV